MSLLNSEEKNSDRKNKMDSMLGSPIGSQVTTQYPNCFHFWNGDEYAGQFAVLKDKQKIVMQGPGKYQTSDGETYEGIWENDCLKKECKITFPDKSVFTGNLEDMVIQGPGKYSFKENVEMKGEFVENNFTGKVDLKDPNNRVWRGNVNAEESFIDFYPLHPFWQSVLNSPYKTFQQYYGEGEEGGENVWEGFYYT